MNKQYALEILEMVDRMTLEKDSSLTKEAIRYLERLKKIDPETIKLIHKIRHN